MIKSSCPMMSHIRESFYDIGHEGVKTEIVRIVVPTMAFTGSGATLDF